MICPDCLGDGVIIIDESHTEICGMCDGHGSITLVDGKREDRDDKSMPEVRPSPEG